MKKKILSVCLVAVIAIMAIAGATLAYLTDTDKADNVFTIGNVQIELVEQQRNDEGTGLEAFEPKKVLLPIVESAQGEKETVDGVAGLPTSKNYVDKIITVKNTGASDAYMRVYIAIPVVLDNVGDASQNILHFNWTKESRVEGEWGSEEAVAQNVDVNGVNCNIYQRTYTSVVVKDNATKTPAYIGFYLDKKVDNRMENGKIIYTINGTDIDYDFSKGVTIPVFAVAVQADGFDSADQAMSEAFGANYNPWAQ